MTVLLKPCSGEAAACDRQCWRRSSGHAVPRPCADQANAAIRGWVPAAALMPVDFLSGRCGPMAICRQNAGQAEREVFMKADEAAEMMERDRETDRFKQRAAITIAILAMLLALTSLGGSNAAK